MKTVLAWTAIAVSCFWLPYLPGSMEVWALAVLGLLTAAMRFHDRQLLRGAYRGGQKTNRERFSVLWAFELARAEREVLRMFIEMFVSPRRVHEVLEYRAMAYQLVCKSQQAFYQRLKGIDVPEKDIELALTQGAQTFDGLKLAEERWKSVVRTYNRDFWVPHDLAGELISQGLISKDLSVREGKSFTKYLPMTSESVLAEGANEQPGQ